MQKFSAGFKPLCAALLIAGFATDAEAVQLSSTGTGQVLLFPYYTVRSGFSTLLTVVNTQSNAKIVKVRFREALNARPVLDFNLFLTANDTWTGAVVATARGARLITNDNSCVTPAELFTENRADGFGLPLNEFKNYLYTGTYADTAQFASLDRTREGYVEVMEMGVLDQSLSPAAREAALSLGAGLCADLDGFDPLFGKPIHFPDSGARLLTAPSSGLSGRASLINAATGANFSFVPTALEGFTSQVTYGGAGADGKPSLADAFPAVSTVASSLGSVTASWSNGRDAVSAVLMRETVINEFVIDEGTASQTDWLVTFPTKYLYTDRRYAVSGGSFSPFSTDSSTAPDVACERYGFSAYNREGASLIPTDVICPLPPPAPVGTRSLCLVAGVIPLASQSSVVAGVNSASGLLGAALPARTGGGGCPFAGLDVVSNSVTTPFAGTTPSLRNGSQGPNGVINLRFATSFNRLTPLSATSVSSGGGLNSVPGIHYGMPVIGLMLHNYKNANVTSRYGGVLVHRYTVRIE